MCGWKCKWFGSETEPWASHARTWKKLRSLSETCDDRTRESSQLKRARERENETLGFSSSLDDYAGPVSVALLSATYFPIGNRAPDTHVHKDSCTRTRFLFIYFFLPLQSPWWLQCLVQPIYVRSLKLYERNHKTAKSQWEKVRC